MWCFTTNQHFLPSLLDSAIHLKHFKKKADIFDPTWNPSQDSSIKFHIQSRTNIDFLYQVHADLAAAQEEKRSWNSKYVVSRTTWSQKGILCPHTASWGATQSQSNCSDLHKPESTGMWKLPITTGLDAQPYQIRGWHVTYACVQQTDSNARFLLWEGKEIRCV